MTFAYLLFAIGFVTACLALTPLLRQPTIMKWRGHKRIFIKRVDRDGNREGWYANILVDPFGDTHAWRYPTTRIGWVTLDKDGTGEYYGRVDWIEV